MGRVEVLRYKGELDCMRSKWVAVCGVAASLEGVNKVGVLGSSGDKKDN